LERRLLVGGPRERLEVKDLEEPELYREMFPFTDVPRVYWDFVHVPTELPDQIYITDTTFRDGQQAYEPYTVEQIVNLYELIHRLGGPNGVIRWSEFFLYTPRDREAVNRARELGYEYPKVTGWIRAAKGDLQLVKEMKLEETGILTSISDYHVFYKFRQSRSQVIQKYLQVAEEALQAGIAIRCHLEDVTRADVRGAAIPFVQSLLKLEEKYGVPVKIRLCDTLGLGVPYPEASLPRSVPKLVRAVREAGAPPDRIEWHGHNDFHKGVVNAAAAWLYGCAYNNCTLLSVGERAGNVPLEAMVMEYIQLKGAENGMETRVISEVADYYATLGYNIPAYYPYVGRNFNVTRAGIHADGLLKDIELYLPFDTEKVLGRAPGIVVTSYSGFAGVAFWANRFLGLKGEKQIPKDDPRVRKIHEWVMKQYDEGRQTSISDPEMEEQVKANFPELYQERKKA